jgi:hypothetical protein
VIKGGTILDVLWPEAEPLIARGGWDVIALQDRNVELLEQPERAREVAKRYGARIRAVGARGVYYQKYEFRHQPGTQPRIDQATVAATDAAGLTVAWIGRAWERVRRARPDLALFEDDEHPTATGAYLIGCVFYATIYGKSPVGLPAAVDAAGPGGKAGERVEVAPDVARLLQEAAASAALP